MVVVSQEPLTNERNLKISVTEEKTQSASQSEEETRHQLLSVFPKHKFRRLGKWNLNSTLFFTDQLDPELHTRAGRTDSAKLGPGHSTEK